MNGFLERTPLFGLLFLGVWFARRWVVCPPPEIRKYPAWLRISALIVACWIGIFVASGIGLRIGYRLADGIAYDDGAPLPYDVMHDGVGSNVVNLFLGWSVGLVCWGIAKMLFGRPGAEDSRK